MLRRGYQTFSESHCTSSSSSFFAFNISCASSISLRVTTTFVFAMVSLVILEMSRSARCGVEVAVAALLQTTPLTRCEDICDMRCIGVRVSDEFHPEISRGGGEGIGPRFPSISLLKSEVNSFSVRNYDKTQSVFSSRAAVSIEDICRSCRYCFNIHIFLTWL
jgi:hypothetical protein